MYIMGFDYGSKRIGVAVGQTLTASARPLAIVLVKNQEIDWARISALIQEWQPDAFVVGLSKYADGSDSEVTVATRSFSRQLQERYQLPIHTIDETLSSVAAAEQIREGRAKSEKGGAKRRKGGAKRGTLQGKSSNSSPAPSIDAVAAKIILETWFAECQHPSLTS
jgi:putative Holliday junction resolvase